MATTMKINIDKATVRQLFKAVVKASDEILEASFVYGQHSISVGCKSSHWRRRQNFMCQMVIRTGLFSQPMVTPISEDGPTENW